VIVWNVLQLFLKEDIATPSNPTLMVYDDTQILHYSSDSERVQSVNHSATILYIRS